MQEDRTDRMQLQDTIDNGESVVQIAEIGRVMGSDVDGNPVEQDIDEESLKKLADKLNASGREILVDRDHASAKPGLERDTAAQGWASDFEVREGQGLFGRVRWSDIGKKLVENRVFRWLSPVFKLDSGKKPVDMKAIALTNTPSQMLLKPVLNQAPEEAIEETDEVREDKDMEIEEIKKVVFEVLKEAGLVKDDRAEVVEEVREDSIKDAVKEEVKDSVEDKLDDLAEKKADEVIEEAKTEEAREEAKNEACDEVKEKKEEVIKAEVLNQKPTLGLAARADADKWRSMSHTEFMKYINSGAYKQDM